MTDKKHHAEPESETAEPSTITVYNRGRRTFNTSAGPLGPEKSVTVPEKEGKELLDYRELSDIAKMGPKNASQDAELKALKKTKADLENELASTKKELDEANAKIAELQSNAEDAKATHHEAKKHKGK